MFKLGLGLWLGLQGGGAASWLSEGSRLGYAAMADFNQDRYALPDTGPELLPNSGFDTDTAGWTTENATSAVVAGIVTVTATGVPAAPAIFRTTTTPEIGKVYEATTYVEVIAGRSGAVLQLAAGSTVVTKNSTGTGWQKITAQIVVPSGSGFLSVRVYEGTGAPAVGVSFRADYISLKEVSTTSLGPEKIANGTFDADLSGWTVTNLAGSSFVWQAPGVARFTGDGTNATTMLQVVATTVGQLYRVTYTLAENGASSVQIYDTGGLITNGPNTVGTQVAYFTARYATTTLSFGKTAANSGTVDNVSVKEVLPQPTLRPATRDEWFAAYTAASTAERTYIDSDGILRTMGYGRTNLALQSGSFSTVPWIGVLTAGLAQNPLVTRPDGTTGAWSFAATTSSGAHYLDQSVTGLADNAICSAQIRVKRKDYPYARFAVVIKNGSNPSMVLNFDTGGVTFSDGVGQVAGTVRYSATPEADGWYLLKMENFSMGTGATTPRLRPSLCDDTGAATFVGDGVKGTYFDCVQLELGPDCTSYIPTTTTAATGANAPRFDFTNGKRQLLLENAATNGVRNNTMVGAAVGSPGTVPTGWGPNAIDADITAIQTHFVGVVNGIEIIEIEMTANKAATRYYRHDNTAMNQAAAVGQVWTASQYLQLMSVTGTVQMGTFLGERGTGGVNVGIWQNVEPVENFLTMRRQSITATFANAATLYAMSAFIINFVTAGTARFRIGLPQLEMSPFMSAPIKTTNAAVTRAIETFRLPPIVEAVLQKASGGVVVRGQGFSSQGVLVGGDLASALLGVTSATTGVVTRDGAAAAILNGAMGALGSGGQYGGVVAYDATGHTVSMNGITPLSTATAIPAHTQVYLSRNASLPTGFYNNGRYDFVGILASRPSNAQLQALAVPA